MMHLLVAHAPGLLLIVHHTPHIALIWPSHHFAHHTWTHSLKLLWSTHAWHQTLHLLWTTHHRHHALWSITRLLLLLVHDVVHFRYNRLLAVFLEMFC